VELKAFYPRPLRIGLDWIKLDAALKEAHKDNMNIEDIRHRLKNGFRPFMLHLSDGRTCAVPHPEFIWVTRRSVAVSDKDGFIDIIDPLHIVSLKEMEAKNA